MKIVRPLTRRLTPEPDESFSSYVQRCAAQANVSLLVMLSYLGIIADERFERMSGYGFSLSQHQMEQFCCATGLTPERVESMLVRSYCGVVFRGPATATPDCVPDISELARQEWVYFSGSHICPECIAESDGAWKLQWKMPWSFACTKHRCYLVSTCPGCNQRLGRGRADHSLSPVFVHQIPLIGRCNNPKAPGQTIAGKGAQPCGHLLSDIPITPANADTLQTQLRINAMLQEGLSSQDDARKRTLSYFQDLRSLVALFLSCAEAEDFPNLSKQERERLDSFTTHRDAVDEERRNALHPRNGPRTRVYTGPPTDPILLAGVIKYAVAVLDAASMVERVELLAPLAFRSKLRAKKSCWAVVENFNLNGLVKEAFHDALAHYSTFDRLIGARSGLERDTTYTYNAAHVPQLLWRDEYQRHFASMFDRVNDNNARRYCSMALVKLSGQYTWAQAAELLGLPVEQSVGMANRVACLMKQDGTKKKFGAALHKTARQLSSSSNKIDYGLRRQQFKRLIDIPRATWEALCHTAGVGPGHIGSRSRYATAWLWAQLTDGDWTLAPGMHLGEVQENERERYRQLAKTIFPQLDEVLMEYARRELLGNEEG